jgi:hypothetical protein
VIMTIRIALCSALERRGESRCVCFDGRASREKQSGRRCEAAWMKLLLPQASTSDSRDTEVLFTRLRTRAHFRAPTFSIGNHYRRRVRRCTTKIEGLRLDQSSMIQTRPYLAQCVKQAVKGYRAISSSTESSRLSIARLLDEKPADPKDVVVTGFIRSIRNQKQRSFASIGDGSSLEPLQALLTPSQAQRSKLDPEQLE